MKKLKEGRIKLKSIKHIENSRLRGKDDVSELMADIEQHGLLEPIGIRAKDNALIFGNRRVSAFDKLGYEEIDCIYFDDVSDEDILILNLTENIKRKSIGSIEIGRMCHLLKERGMTPSEIAVKLGVSKSRVHGSMSAYSVTVGTPFEQLVIFGEKSFGRASGRKNIPEGLIWKIQTSLSRGYHKLTKSDWNILLRAIETGKLNSKNLSALRYILQSDKQIGLIRALDVLDRVKIVYAYMSFNEEELMKAMRKEKVAGGIELIREIIKKYNPDLLF